jgi:DNA-binding CsgD family transcriptional regulator
MPGREGESQRTIAVSIDIHQPTVSKALTRLHTANVLTKLPTENSRNSRNSPGYLLRTAKEVSIEETKTAGLPIDNPARAAVHPLFGAGGLGAGPADTFALLSELSRPVLRGRLIRTRQGSEASALLADPYLTVRQIPRPEPGQGLTVAQLADQRGRSTSTLRNHLKVLRRVGLAFQVAGLWWRTRFDPEALVAELQINDTAALKRLTYHRQRRQWWDANAELVDSQNQPLYVKTLVDGHATFVDPNTGVVAWRDPHPEVHAAPDAPA